MKEQPLISIIVPIYKVEKYLEKCVMSIIDQTYQNLEIILVDDGSPDRCGEICEEFAKQDSRIVVLHKKNGGLSDARNAGIEVATGEYFFFVDSDDYIHPQMIEILYQGIKKNKAELSICQFQNVAEDKNTDYESVKQQEWIVLESDQDKLEYALGENTTTIFTVAWNKLYARRLFDGVRYPFGKIHEDEFTTYKTIHAAKKIAYIECPLYYYVQREGSIMANGFDERNLSVLEAYEERLNLYQLEKKFDWYEKVLFLNRIFLMRFMKKISLYMPEKAELLSRYQKNYRKQVLSNWMKIPCGMKQKLGYLHSAVFMKQYFEKRYLK